MALTLVLNIHGKINSTAAVRKALAELKVERKFSASAVGDDPVTLGILRLCKDYVAWAPLDAPLLKTLLEKRGMVSTTARLDAAALKAMGYKSHEELAEKMVKDGLRLNQLDGVRPFFRLAPPRGGFKVSMRRQFSEKGMLGSNPKLPELIGRMI
jgi:large subunit ribosomal protein L30